MQKTTWVLMLSCFTIAVASCEKNSSRVTKIQTSKSELKTGEALAVQVQNKDAGSVSKWTVYPSSGAIVDSAYSQGTNMMRFTQPGSYVINAELRVVHPDCHVSSGWDTCFNGAMPGVKLATTVTVKN